MTIEEYAVRLEKAFATLERYAVPGTLLTLVDDAPPEAEEALKIVNDWYEVNTCEWD